MLLDGFDFRIALQKDKTLYQEDSYNNTLLITDLLNVAFERVVTLSDGTPQR
jgi:hypothetical protein